MAYTSDPSAGEAETGRSLGLTAQSDESICCPNQLETLSQEGGGWCWRNDTGGCPLSSACMHTQVCKCMPACVYMYTHTHDAINALLTKFRSVKFKHLRIRD